MATDSRKMLWRTLIFLYIGLSCLLYGACSILSDLAPVKEEVVDVRDWLVVPIFYATNRARADSKQIDFLEKKNNGPLAFGVKNICVPYPEKVSISPEIIDRLGWRLIHLQKAIPSNTLPVILPEQKNHIPDQEFSPREVASAFEKYRGLIVNGDVVVFVHGCCVTFKTSLERTAKLAVQMQTPVIVYSWVSPIGFEKYLENGTLAQQAYDSFCTFLDRLAQRVPTDKTIVIGHSMGAGFIDEAFVRRFERSYGGKVLPKYKEIIFSQPDIDARVYLNHDKNTISQANKTTIFMVSDDPRLRTAALAHGRFERLGLPGPLLDELCKLDTQDIIDLTVSGIGHNLPARFIGSMYRIGTINGSDYNLVQKQKHLFILERNDSTTPTKH